MNFNQLYKEALLVDPKATIMIKCERCNTPYLNLKEWVIWSVKLQDHFRGSTPEKALEKYKKAINV